MPVQVGSPYRIFVRFEPPLSTTAQLRALFPLVIQRRVLLVGLSAAQASIVVVPVKQKDAAALQVGRHWFTLEGGIPASPVSTAVITRVLPEINLQP